MKRKFTGRLRGLAIAAFCAGSAAHGQQMAVTVQGATATQALLYYMAPDTNPCTVAVSQSAAYTPLVADVDPALFPGSNSDSVREILPAGTARLIRIGLRAAALASDGRWHSRALAEETTHYVRIKCNGASGTATFTTGTPEGFAPEPLPTDPNGWGNLAYPEFDFTDLTKPVIDPRTGVQIYSADPKGWSMSAAVPIPANWFAGGSGWSNAGNITSYGAGVASTGNMNPIALFFDATLFTDQLRVSGGNWPFDNFLDLGVDLYGSGSDGLNPANRIVQLALSLDSGQTAYTQWVSATLPVLTAMAGTFPAQYPSTYFAGWGKILPRNAWPKQGFVAVSNSQVTLTKNDVGEAIGGSSWDDNSYFIHEWAAGTKIWINNSSPACANNFCTIASVQNSKQLTIDESLTLAENQYRSAALAVIVQKTTGSGAVNLSAQLRIAKGYPHDIWTAGCAPNPVTSADGIVGYPCIFPHVRQDAGGLYFIGSSQPAIRLVSLFANPGTIPGTAAADAPYGTITLLGPSVPCFDPNDSTIMYTSELTNGGSPGLFKIQYTGNWTALNTAFQSNSSNPPYTSELTWTNVTPSALGRDMRSQILANTSYNESSWGALTSLQIYGVTGKYAIFVRWIGTQESPCWVFTFDSSSGNFYRAWRSDDGSSLPGLKYAGCHAVEPIDGNAIFLASNGLRWYSNSLPYGGPFSAPITAVMRDGAFDATNTALTWPPAAPPATNGYDSTCPANLNPLWQANGAVGNQCVTIQTKEPCSSYPTASEMAAAPCPWDPTQSMVAPLAEGDFLKQRALWDSEGYMVVQKTSLGGGLIQLVLQRNANFSYCAIGKDGIDGAAQAMPANGWVYDAVPPGACFAAGIVIDVVNNASYVANQNLLRGHFDVTGSGPGADTWIGVGAFVGATPVYMIDNNRPFSLLPATTDFAIPSNPPFAGYNSVHDVQSYIDAKQRSATAAMRRYAFDFRHYNGSTGIDLEVPNQFIGNATNLTLQAGTAAVYGISYSGTADAKHGVFNVWAGEKVLIEKSSAATGNTLTDADVWHFCYAYVAGECRTGSTAGDMFAVIPDADLETNCWASQLNLRIPCAMAGPVQAMRAMQIRISAVDPAAMGQRILSSLLMGPNQQYVYSSVLPTPDASYLLFAGFLVNGYQTGLLAMKLPSFVENTATKSTYVPVTVQGTSSQSVYVEFGYEENGAAASFYCTPRQETCQAGSAFIDEQSPFWYAHEPFLQATGSYKIMIPALPGRILYYHIVDGGVAGDLRAVTVSDSLGR